MTERPIYFPVRHYSPASARFLDALLLERRFDAVLIEGPADFNERMDELFFAHELPLALYSFVVFDNGVRCGAFYPFCEFSPEWRALVGARKQGACVRFIDAPFSQLLTLSALPDDFADDSDEELEHAQPPPEEHRYSDENFQRNPYIDRLCDKLSVESFDELWDVLFELAPLETWEEYVQRARALCDNMREIQPLKEEENAFRERYMAAEIRRAIEEFGPNILVVTGGYHSPMLEVLVGGDEPSNTPGAEHTSVAIARSGIALTPFTYPRIDRLSGYPAGLQGPALYEALFEARKQGRAFDASRMLGEIARSLRNHNQIASTADMLAVQSTAKALARLRGREEVWRYDLLDALSSALIKEAQDSEYSHPFLLVAREIFTGTRRGSIDPAAGVPPLAREVREKLEQLGLRVDSEGTEITLDLAKAEDLKKSRLLHRCATLGIAGVQRIGGQSPHNFQSATRFTERWRLSWSPEFEASLIECSAYGTTLEQAARLRLLEWHKNHGRSAATAARALVEAVQMGLTSLEQRFVDDVCDCIIADGDFYSLTDCLAQLLFLHHFDAIFRVQANPGLALVGEEILETAFERGLWLFETLGRMEDQSSTVLTGIATLYQASNLGTERTAKKRGAALSRTAKRITGEDTQDPLVRGASCGICLRFGTLEKERVRALWNAFYDPLDTGDFLTGLFRMAREAFVRDRPFLLSFDAFLLDLDEEGFLEVLPALRLAFTYFTPREKLEICDLLFTPAEPLVVDEDAPRSAEQFEAALHALASRYGIDLSVEARSGRLAAENVETSWEALELTADRQKRWRLILGQNAKESLGGLEATAAAWESHVAFLYDREVGAGQNIRRSSGRSGGLDPSTLAVPDWINGVHELFPRRTIERLERDALERYGLDEIVTRPDILERLEPNPTLLKAVLRCKPLMNQQVLKAARQLVKRVIEDLMKRWSREISTPFQGAPDRRRRSPVRLARNFDARETIRRNLRHYDPATAQLVIRRPYFFSRRRRHVDRWQIIILVDQSGSMVDSVIHSAITASILAGVQTIRTHLVAFDTNVVDLTDDCRDPVETLMSVQLGGGTDIARALRYAETLVDNPRRAVVVLVTDFFEGAPVQLLFDATRALVESGVTLLGLAALDHEAVPYYDRKIARRMADLGAHVGAMTPGELAEWLAEKVR